MWRVLIVAAGVALTGCSAHQGVDVPPSNDPFSSQVPADFGRATADDPRDPFEPVNRGAWVINYDVLEPYVVRPAAHAYADYVAEPVRDGLQNVVLNLEEPASFVNHLITGDIPGAGTNLARFGVNSTVGVLGYFDVAEKMSLPRRSKDFSQVLGQLGIGDGPYLMVPVLGPTTLRQLSGDMVDSLYFPYDVMSFAMRTGKWALDGLYQRSELIEREPIIDNALDPYGLTKDLYLQYQDTKIGKEFEPASSEELDAFMDEIDG
ncbi:VacJ family lipoprotein [Oceanisphaera sp.]|uniref:MlaA family lipoprotein n=1 Tax=Oceanisphaera sp. TaxID=1929979 RepID=UPI003A94A11B